MKDHEYSQVIFIALGLGFLWWWFHHKQALASMVEIPNTAPASDDPQALMYAANPSAFDPAGINANINISNQGLGYLDNKYMPLFGFVGMAQGVAYQ